MDIRKYILENTVFLDGGMGTLLQDRGLGKGELPEQWNITHPEEIINIHKSYFDAGSNVVNANTFGANSIKYSDEELEKIIRAAISNAKEASARCCGTQPRWVALDIGPTGKLLAPFGELDFEDAVEVFAKTVRLGVKYGADLVFIETMNDIYETKAALLAAKENCDLPVFVSNAYGESGRLMTGSDPKSMIAMLEGMGAFAVGVNCSFGPQSLRPVVEQYLKYASVPVFFKPNAGLPKLRDGKTVFDVSVEDFEREVRELVRLGVRAVGGCCGTTPAYISALVSGACGIAPIPLTDKGFTCVSSRSHTVFFGGDGVLIGARTVPEDKEQVAEDLMAGDVDYYVDMAYEQEEDEVDVLRVYVGLDGVDEASAMEAIVCELQTTMSQPLMIDTDSPASIEAALRRYIGKALVYCVRGRAEDMDAVFPIVKRYGGVVVVCAADDSGEPLDAKSIAEAAQKYGIGKKDILIYGDSAPVVAKELGCQVYPR